MVWQGWPGNLSHNVIKISSKATKLVDWELSNSIILVVLMVLKEILQNIMLSWTSVSSRHHCSGHSLSLLFTKRYSEALFSVRKGKCADMSSQTIGTRGRVGGTREETMIEWGWRTKERKKIGKENKNEEGMKGQIQILHTRARPYVCVCVMGEFSCKTERLRDGM